MQRPRAIWIGLRASLWFVPTLIVLASMAIGHALVEAGTHVPALSQENLPPIFGFSPEGSRAMLSGIATSMITVAGVAFSITVVTLSLASSQYSPRVLRQFMRDRANQWVLGVFVGVFAYCLTVLPRLRGGNEDGFVPALAVAGAVIYALAGVGCLIFFIHHVATSIQASCIVSDIAAETRAAAAQLYPETTDGKGEQVACDVPGAAGPWRSIPTHESGYIQLVEEEELLEIAAKHDVVVRMEHGVGEFVVADRPLVSVSGRGADSGELAAALRGVFTISRTRTIEQDVLFGVRQIVDVALRALSPSLNDPTTATLCVDYLTTILTPLASRQMGKRVRRYHGVVRSIGCEPTFSDLVRTAYGEIIAAAASQPLVLRGILRGLEMLTEITVAPQSRTALREVAIAVSKSVEDDSPDFRCGEIRAEAERLIRKLPTHGLEAAGGGPVGV